MSEALKRMKAKHGDKPRPSVKRDTSLVVDSKSPTHDPIVIELGPRRYTSLEKSIDLELRELCAKYDLPLGVVIEELLNYAQNHDGINSVIEGANQRKEARTAAANYRRMVTAAKQLADVEAGR